MITETTEKNVKKDPVERYGIYVDEQLRLRQSDELQKEGKWIAHRWGRGGYNFTIYL